jgi:UDP-N-acetylglucosamine enolpyruvyl transferase
LHACRSTLEDPPERPIGELEHPVAAATLPHEVVAWLEDRLELAFGDHAADDDLVHAGASILRSVDRIAVRQSGPLEGTVTISGAKNSVLKLMAATTLAPGEYVLHNVPEILDVTWMAELLETMGMTVERPAPGDLRIMHDGELTPEAPYELVERMRASIVVLGPLLARYGRAKVALPGGDDFGPRPIDMHLRGLEELGATFEFAHGYIEGYRARIRNHGHSCFLCEIVIRSQFHTHTSRKHKV